MSWGFLVVVAAWVIIGVAGSKKRRQMREEAEKRAAAARQQAESAASTGREAPAQSAPRPVVSALPYYPEPSGSTRNTAQSAPHPAAPYSPYYPQTQKSTPSQTAHAAPATPAGRPAAAARSTVPGVQPQAAPVTRTQAAPASRLKEIQQTQRHTLMPSGESDHIHQETSLTGIQADCPPSKERAPHEQSAPAAASGLPSFSWQPNAVLNGMVYAEILQKPKALR